MDLKTFLLRCQPSVFSLMYAHELVALISPNSANWSKTHEKVVHVLNACIDILSQSQLHFSLHPIILNIVTLCCRRATPDEIKPIREREDDFFDNFQKSINFRRFFAFLKPSTVQGLSNEVYKERLRWFPKPMIRLTKCQLIFTL